MSIKQNIKKIKNITGDSIKIVAVTKNRNEKEILEAINCGITDIGENRLQEAKNKLIGLPRHITKHFIGRLQTNKIKDIVSFFDIIQSVDSLKSAEKIDKECKKINKIMPILLQINTSGEAQKGGMKPEDTFALIQKIADMPNVKIQGLMTMAIDSDDDNQVKKCFSRLKTIFDEIKQKKIPNMDMKWLSMGMSKDYELALNEGSDMIRIGSGIFS